MCQQCTDDCTMKWLHLVCFHIFKILNILCFKLLLLFLFIFSRLTGEKKAGDSMWKYGTLWWPSRANIWLWHLNIFDDHIILGYCRNISNWGLKHQVVFYFLAFNVYHFRTTVYVSSSTLWAALFTPSNQNTRSCWAFTRLSVWFVYF